jgi:hypothetical protein
MENQKSTGIISLRIIAWSLLVIGIIIGLALLNNLVNNSTQNDFFTTNTILIGGLVSAIICWAFFLVICTIAESLLKIQAKILPNNKTERAIQEKIQSTNLTKGKSNLMVKKFDEWKKDNPGKTLNDYYMAIGESERLI